MKTNIQPLHDRVLVKKIPDPTQPPRSIILAADDPRCVDTHGGDYRRNFIWGEILSVGPGKFVDGAFYKTEVKPGMKVAFSDWNDFIDPNSPSEKPEYEIGEEFFGLAMIREGDIGLIYGKHR